MKQTAVEFLISKLNPYGLSESQTLVFEQAKEMEKQQIIDAYSEGDVNGLLPSKYPCFNISSTNHSTAVISYLINCSSSLTFCFQLSNTSYSVVCLRSNIDVSNAVCVFLFCS